MAEDKKKEAEAKAEGGKKKGLSALVMIAVGAVIGGAGVVFVVPPKKIEVPVAKPALRIQPIKHPDVLEITFNPQTDAGKGFASIKFKFTYEVREDLVATAEQQVVDHWDRARQNCLFMLCGRTVRDLQGPNKQALAKDLMDTLDKALFPDDEHKVAHVTEVYVVDMMLQ